MRISTVRTLQELDSIKEVWKAFADHPSGPTVFQSWTWNRIWCDQVLAGNPHMRLAVKLVENSAGRPVAILPFFEQAIVGPILQVTQFLCHRVSPTYGVLLADPLDRELAADIIENLCSNQGGCSFIHLRQMPDESVFTSELIARGLAEPQCERVWVDADPEVMDPLTRVSKSRRKHIRRAERSLQAKGMVEYRVCRGNEFTSAFDELITLHHRRFSQKRQKTNLTSSNVSFLKAVGEKLSHREMAEVLLLRFNDVNIAGLFQIIDRDHYYSLISGFDPDFSDYAPIWLLDVEGMRRGFTKLGCMKYEFGAAYDEYKYSWKPSVGINYFANLGGKSLASRLTAKAYQHIFRRRLPKFSAAHG